MTADNPQFPFAYRSVQQPAPLPAPDPWADFRQVAVIDLAFTQHYQHSLGKLSRFFLELGHGRFMVTSCPECGQVFAPPRSLCPQCHQITVWQALAGTGTLKTYTLMHFSNGANADVQALALPIILAYVLMDGASTLFPHILKADAASVHAGMRVQVAYSQDATAHPIHQMYFIPLEDV